MSATPLVSTCIRDLVAQNNLERIESHYHNYLFQNSLKRHCLLSVFTIQIISCYNTTLHTQSRCVLSVCIVKFVLESWGPCPNDLNPVMFKFFSYKKIITEIESLEVIVVVWVSLFGCSWAHNRTRRNWRFI